MPSVFAKHILHWQANNPRPLPWDNGPRDPYHIWISEIIMQQTRIEQGAPYYLKFVNRFPSVKSLADAPLDEVLRYWQGLGYYTRARNVHKAAVFINQQLDGVFPDTYEGLLALPGIGPYSAAAISSFAFGLSYPVVDGNVKRVISRYEGITSSIDEPTTHNAIRDTASKYMKGVSPGAFNQAIMNFGALVCKPVNPGCTTCPLSRKCYALENRMVTALPVRSKKKSVIFRYFHFVVITWHGKVLLQRRDGKDIWQGLYTPPMMERTSPRAPSIKQLESFVESITGLGGIEHIQSSPAQQQLLSHQTIVGRFHFIRLLSPPPALDDSFVWVTKKMVDDYARPKMIVHTLMHI